jgi:hypothetical protein
MAGYIASAWGKKKLTTHGNAVFTGILSIANGSTTQPLLSQSHPTWRLFTKKFLSPHWGERIKVRGIQCSEKW